MSSVPSERSEREKNTHGNKLGNTFSSWKKIEKKRSVFLFSGDTENFITCISNLGLA